MPFKDLEKKDLITILELIDEARRSHGAAGVQRLMLRAAGFLEADYAVCGLASTGQDGSPSARSFVNGNYPEEYARWYIEGACYRKDPVVRFHTRYALTRTWSEVFREFDDDGAREVVERASDYGLKFGVTGALYLPEVDNVAIFSFAGGRDSFNERHKRLADILAAHLVMALAGCAGESIISPGPFFAGQGNTDWLEGKV